jgi:ADP-ribose pyrophosphatase
VEPAESRTAFQGRLIRVEVQRWEDPDREREVVRHPGAAAIVALTGDGEVILVRQLREAVGKRVLEVPAGVLDVRGEEPEAAAVRELHEETGYRAEGVEPLGAVYSSPGFSDERIELFLARADPEGDGEPGIEVVLVPFDEAADAVLNHRIVDAKTALGILLAASRREGPSAP